MIYFYCNHIQNFHFLTNGRTPRLLSGLEAISASLLSCFGAIITVNKGFLNTNTTITQQLIRTARTLEAESLQVCGKRDYGDKGRWVKYLARLGRWISPCYSPFSLGAPFLKLWTVYFFNFLFFFFGPRPTADTAVHLYVELFLQSLHSS